jgi:hypothetical protein
LNALTLPPIPSREKQASFLVVENTPSLQIETVEDAVRLNLPLCVMGGTVPDALVSEAYPGARFVRKPVELGEEETYLGVRRGECTLVLTTVNSWDQFKRNSKVNGDCKMTWIGRVFRFLPAGFATFSDSGTLCTNLIRDVFNIHLLEMEESGFIRQVWEKNLERNASVLCEAGSSSGTGDIETNGGNSRLTLQEMGGLFIVFYVVVAFSSCMALFTVWSNKRKSHRTEDIEDTAPREGQMETAVAECPSLSRQVSVALEKLNCVQRELEAVQNIIHVQSNGSEETSV